MKNLRFKPLITCCLAMVLLFPMGLFAANIIYDQSNVDLTRAGVHAHDYDIGNGRNQIILADDWLQDDSITQFNMVSDAHWFGYVENNDPHSTMCVGFHLSIHTQSAGACVPMDPSIWEKEVPLSHITVTDTGLTNFLGETLYRYDYYLDTPVPLTFGQKYWFDVSANSVDLTVPFKWKWANAAPPINYCPAAQKIVDGPPDPWTSLDDTDLAFTITADEPPETGDMDFGDAPEGDPQQPGTAIAYPSLGVQGKFPTCITVGPPNSWIQHTNFGAWFGNTVDFEFDGNAGACGTAACFPPYDLDECFDSTNNGNNTDPGLIMPESYTIDGLGNVVACPPWTGTALGQTCAIAVWGQDIDIWVHNTMPSHPEYLPAYVNVLIDWNQDGTWGGTASGPGCTNVPEHVLVDFVVPPLYIGPLSALTPPNFQIGPNRGYAWARFSITERPVSPNNERWDGSGAFEDGETEDYLLRIDPSQTTDELDFGDAPEFWPDGTPTGYPTTVATGNNGARHIISANGPYFDDGTAGDFPDPEPDGQPTTPADGDDIDANGDDEDGVIIPPLIQGQTATISFFVGGPGGGVEAFIDWNADGDWADSGEALPPASYGPGPQTMTVPVPASAVVGPTYARFRISNSTVVPMGYAGQAPDGEVEDYLVFIEPGEEPERLKFQQLPLDGAAVRDVRYWGHDEVSTVYPDYGDPGPVPQIHRYLGCYMADDFADYEHSPVIRVKWWGSYLGGELAEEQPQPVNSFVIAFETDNPGPPSHPEFLLQHEEVMRDMDGILTPGEFSERFYSPGGPPCHEPVYEYEAILQNPFPQDPNTVYWLKIVAVVDLPPGHPFFSNPMTNPDQICDFLNYNYEPEPIHVTRWGWHNRDYTKMDPFASMPPAVVPGEHIQGVIPDGTADGVPVWHFQDDCVTGAVQMPADDNDPAVYRKIIDIEQHPDFWREQYYKFMLPYCFGQQGVDGPDEIEQFSKDLAFELWTNNDCFPSTDPSYWLWVSLGKPKCWCYPCHPHGDYNGDDLITAIDVQALLAAWPPNPYDPCGDFNHDGFITAIDVQILLASWGVGCP